MSWENESAYCPACHAALAPGAAECAACGVVLEKWRAKQARESVEAFARKEEKARRQSQPVWAAAPPPPPRASVPRRLAGATLAAGAVAGLFWLHAPGRPGPAADGSPDAATPGFSFVPPKDWVVVSRDPRCSDGGCVIAAYRLDGPKGRLNPSITLRYLDGGPDRMTGRDRKMLESSLRESVRAAVDEGEAGPVVAVDVDGLPALKVQGSGTKHMRLQLQARVTMNAQAYMREKGLTSTMARMDSRTLNPYVVTQEEQHIETDVNKVDGRVVVPLRRKLLQISFEYDQADGEPASGAVEALLSSLRVSPASRSRPMDRLGEFSTLAHLGAAAAAFAAFFLFL